MPGIAAGTILVFISSLGMFVVPDVMGGAKSALSATSSRTSFWSARDWPFGSAALHCAGSNEPCADYPFYYKALQSRGKEGHKDAKDVA